MRRLIVAGFFGLCFTVTNPSVDSQGTLTFSVTDSEACGVKVAVKAAPPKRNLKKRTARAPIKRGGSRVAVRTRVGKKSARKPIASGPDRQARTPKRTRRPPTTTKRTKVAVVEKKKAEPEVAPVPAEPEVVEPKPVKTSKRKPKPVVETAPADEPTEKAVASGAPVVEVYFELGMASLTSEAEEALADHIAWLKDNPGGKLVIEGHTDPKGSASANRKLSIERATAVRDFLASEASIDADQLQVVGRGERRLRYKSSAKNRRVVVRGRK